MQGIFLDVAHPAIHRTDTDEEVLTREVYARYGLAMYLAQVLEHGMINALMVRLMLPARKGYSDAAAWELAYDAFWNRETGKTFGRLVGSIAEMEGMPQEFIDRLREANRKRIVLAHSFFRDHAEDFMTEEGKARMIYRCVGAGDHFLEVDRALEELVRPHRIRHGLTDERLDGKLREMKAAAQTGTAAP